ncbi:MAG: FMN-binding protein [Oscillospiraceae bacterium]|jgi:electron transport complex protein RnfG|nr:FMN-binding protein [Oscillospiraceae bacterium]
MRDDFAEIENGVTEPAPSGEGISPAEAKKKRELSKYLGVTVNVLQALRRFFKKDSMPNLVLVMVLLTSVTAAGLGAVYAVTSVTIEENDQIALNKTLNDLFPGQALLFTETSEGSGIYQGRNSEGELVGFGVKTLADGFAGKGSITMMVGIDVRTQSVTRVSVMKQRETTGFSLAAKRDPFLEQFNGRSAPFVIGEGVDAIAGATVSSEAVAQGINNAFALLETEGSP